MEWLNSGGSLSPEGSSNPEFLSRLREEIFLPWNLYRVLSATTKYQEGLRQLSLPASELKAEAAKWLKEPDRIDVAVKATNDAYPFFGLLLKAPATKLTAVVRQLRLRLLGATAKAVMEGALPTPKGRLLLAAMILLPEEDDCFEYQDVLQELSLNNDESLVKQCREALVASRDCAPLRIKDGIQNVAAVLARPKNMVAEILHAMGMPLDGKALVWSLAAGALSSVPSDPWAALSHRELMKVGPHVDQVIEMLLQAASKLGLTIDPTAPALDESSLWDRQFHIAGWLRFGGRSSRAIETGLKEFRTQLGNTRSVRGQVLLHVLMMERPEQAKIAAKQIGLPESLLEEAKEAYVLAEWGFFQTESDSEQGDICLSISHGIAPPEPEALARAAETLIVQCRERAIVAAKTAMPNGHEWIAEVAFSGAQPPLGTTIAGVLEEIRGTFVRSPRVDVTKLDSDDRFSLAVLGKQYGIATDPILESIVDSWVLEVQQKLKVQGSALKRANGLLQAARKTLVNGGPSFMGHPLARALRERNSDAFEAATTSRSSIMPRCLGEPYGFDKWRGMLVTKRAAALLLVLAVLVWLGATYLWGTPSAARATGSVTSETPSEPKNALAADTWSKLNDAWILTKPVDGVLFHTIAATTIVQTPDASAQRTTLLEAKQWCVDYEAMLRAQSPSWFESGGQFYGFTARLPRPQECQAVGGTIDEWVDQDSSHLVSGNAARSIESRILAATKTFRVVFSPASQEKRP